MTVFLTADVGLILKVICQGLLESLQLTQIFSFTVFLASVAWITFYYSLNYFVCFHFVSSLDVELLLDGNPLSCLFSFL